MYSDDETRNAIQKLLDKYALDYHNHNLEGIMEDWATDPDVMIFGTGADEKRIGWHEIKAQFERNFAEAQELMFEWKWTQIQSKGQIAWLSADALVHVTVNSKTSEFSIRFTAIFEQRDGRWYWVQRHSSAPATSQASGIAYPN